MARVPVREHTRSMMLNNDPALKRAEKFDKDRYEEEARQEKMQDLTAYGYGSVIAKEKKEATEHSRELDTRHDSRESFYGKAKVVNRSDRSSYLLSYGTKVAEIQNGKATVLGTYSPTTTRHIKEYLLQHGFPAESKKQIMKDYGQNTTHVKEHTRTQELSDAPLKMEESKTAWQKAYPELKFFNVDDHISIGAEYKKMRDGFNHYATLFIDGQPEDDVKVHYINRTWESYDFQTAAKRAVEKSKRLTPEEKQKAQAFLNKDHADYSGLEMTRKIAMLGDVFGQNQKEKNDWKARMLKAGLGGRGLEMPEDWDTLSEDEKQRRLDGAIKSLGEHP